MIAQRLTQLGLVLPAPAAPSFNYVPVVLHQGIAYVSGQVPKVDGEVRVFGKVGRDVDLEINGFVASAPGFNDQPKVLDAASDLLGEIFGDAGRHARAAVGVAELPRNCAVEIEMTVAYRA